jgi:hypothetical protein
LSVWDGGLAPVKVREVEAREIVGRLGTLRETVIDWGELVAPAAVTVIAPE